MTDFPTPLIVFQARKGQDVSEVNRVRADQEAEEFWIMLLSNIKLASRGDPDEIIIRMLRPVRE